MSRDNMKKLVSILMNSPFYLTLSVRERYYLLQRLLIDYQVLLKDEDNEAEVK